MKWASIWFRSLSTPCSSSRCSRDWTKSSRISLKARPSFKKKIDNKRDDHQQPRLFRHIRYVQPHVLCQACDFIAMTGQVVAHQINDSRVPAMLLSQLFGDLPELSWARAGSDWTRRAPSRPIRGPMETKNSTTKPSKSR